MIWQYGTKNGMRARRHRISGRVQFVLWKAGEQGHVRDYWHDLHSSHWANFVPNPKPKPVPGSDNLASGAIDMIFLFGCALAALYIYKLIGGQ